jgi:RimJ/RimL family protein N-acetyltransferase
MYKVLVCGGRDFEDAELLYRTLDELPRPCCIIHGAARGADALAAEWAHSRQQLQMPFPAQWSLYGRAAGMHRNIQMLEQGEPDLVVAFEGGRGTAHMVRTSRAAGVQVLCINM